MKIEKKLIACSILAVIIGVSSVLPLVFLMSATAKASSSSEALSSEPWFSINVPYSYWMTKDGKLDSLDVDPEINETTLVSSQYLIALNLTLNVDATDYPADARIEYYQIDVSSDKGPVETRCWFVGTVLDVDSFSFQDFIEDFHFARDEWFDTDEFSVRNRNGGMVRNNWVDDFSLLWRVGNAGSGTIGHSSSSELVCAIREAETLFLSIRRVGWVTFTSNSTIVTLANNEVVEQIQLEKFGEGFLYNDLFAEEELSTIDLTCPPITFEN
ncbi:MAG: hypothetical protein CW691_04140 [Candidatus Bathyarchaeum sp.]|nr:MAG: hypothetical protein CW691_04140 [Candidatus Bathyarchaeum sp.]